MLAEVYPSAARIEGLLSGIEAALRGLSDLIWWSGFAHGAAYGAMAVMLAVMIFDRNKRAGP